MFDRIFVFVRNITLCMIILCLASLFVGLPFAEAHPDTEAFEDAFNNAKRLRDNAYDEEEKWETHYGEAKSAIDTLLSEWDSNADSIKDNTWNFKNTVAATVISMVMDAVLTDESGDGGATKTDWFKELVEALPAILTAINAAKTGSDLVDDLTARDAYLAALSTTISALNEIISQNQVAFNVYSAKYDKYVELMQNHAGGLFREPNHSSTGDYSSVTALSFETIKSTVKDKNAYNAVDSLNKLEFWYHVNDLKSTSQPSSCGFDRFKDFDSFWKLNPLPKNKRCGGDCGQQFQTPVEHLVVCPHALTSSRMSAGNRTLTGLPIDSNLPAGKTTPAGCNDAYFKCSSSERNEHKVRICGKNDSNGNRCNEPYRNCNNPRYPHRWTTTRHSQGGGLIIGPLDGLLNAVPGGSHTASLSVPSGYQYVYWYLAGPSDTGLGTNVETDTGTGSTTSASFSWSVPSDASGDYVITAYTYLSDWSVVQSSYTVSVGSGSSTDTTDTTTTDTSSTTDDSSTSSTADDSSTSSTTDDSSTSSTSPYSLSASNSGQTFSPGDTVTLTLSGNESFYSVDWEVESPQYTSFFPLSHESGDGSSSNSSYTYTFPSSSAYTGDYVFRVIVYTYGNMTRYEETCTVTLGF